MFKLNLPVGQRKRFRSQDFWPEGGLICIENRDTGDFKAITRVEAAARAIALNHELKFIDYPSERDELCKCVVELCESIKEAKRQGDPTDPEVRKHRIKNSRKVSLMMHRESIPPTPPPLMLPTGLFQSDRFRKLRI